jgi:serine protease Do
MKKILILLFAVALAGEAPAQNLPKDAPKLNLSPALPANLFVELGRVINPAVVNISTTAIPKNNPRMRDPMLDMLEPEKK